MPPIPATEGNIMAIHNKDRISDEIDDVLREYEEFSGKRTGLTSPSSQCLKSTLMLAK